MAGIADRIAGKWRIVETATWDNQHLDLCRPALIEIDAQGHGDMAFGDLEAVLDRGFTPNGIDFEWNGADEGDQFSDDGWADLREDAPSKARSPITTVTRPPSSLLLGLVFQQPANSATELPARGSLRRGRGSIGY